MEEVTKMSANINNPAVESSVDPKVGLVWHRLHSEREDICEALLKDGVPDSKAQLTQLSQNEAGIQTANWHRELLQARLRKVDEALDQLMAGRYGECRKCGKWIEDTKLDFDPAIAFCLDCWERMQTIH
jgi:RNA polymerase-binding transcription factor DksA